MTNEIIFIKNKFTGDIHKYEICENMLDQTTEYAISKSIFDFLTSNCIYEDANFWENEYFQLSRNEERLINSLV